MLLNFPLYKIKRSQSSYTYSVVVPSGKVGSNLTRFPVYIDLSHMPSSFWNRVRTDGGNIRAYLSNGSTLVPHDVTYVNKTRYIGRMFVQFDLLSGSNNTIIIKVLDPSTTKLAVTDTNGRNAVWVDYKVVWVFPETTNRTGEDLTQVTTSLLAHSEWIRTDYNSLTGTPHNGICTDETHFLSMDNIAIRRMNMSYVVQQTLTDINSILNPQGIMNITHISDGVCVGSSFFITVTDTTATYRRWLVKMKTSDLTYEAAWEMTGAQRVFGATVCYDGTNLFLFSYTDGTKFIKYTTTGSYLSDVSLTTTTTGIQGSTVLPSGNILISYDPATIKEITPTGGNVGVIYTDPHADIMEGLEYKSGKLWLLKGNGALITLRNDVHVDFRYLHQNDKIYVNMPNSQTWTMGVTSYQVRTDYQYNYIALDDSAGSGNTTGTGILYDEGTGLDKMGIWNSTDGWLYTSTALTPVAYDTIRMAVGHSGTSERKLRIKKGATTYSGVDSTVSARPTGSNMDLLLNSSERTVSQDGAGYFQFAWLRLSYLSNDWLDADFLNNLTPASFYTVTEL